MKLLPTLIAAAVVVASSAVAATFTVTNTNDTGVGSLRQAILSANAVANANPSTPDRIAFNIPSSGLQTIVPLTQLPDITDAVVIDGFSQPGTKVNGADTGQPMNAGLLIELNGNNVPISDSQPSIGLNVTAGGSTIQGVVINRFSYQIELHSPGNGSKVQGCYIGTNSAGDATPINTQTGKTSDLGIVINASANNLIGATFNSGRNLISGHVFNIEVTGNGANGNVIEGNLIGLKASGDFAITPNNQVAGIVTFEGPTSNTVGGTSKATRNVISGHASAGFVNGGVVFASPNNFATGNYVGTDITGTHAVANVIGILAGSSANTVGGSAAGAANLISGNTTAGVYVSGSDNLVVGNRIGTDASGIAPLGNDGNGITMIGTDHSIGGTNAGDGNIIAFNNGFGVFVGNAGNTSGNLIRGNSIYRNGKLGIKSGSNDTAPTPNDHNDADSLQNYPTVTLATISGSNMNVAGNLNSMPNTGFRIDLYADAGPDPSGHGEGRFYLGTALTSTNGSGDALFNLTVPYLPETMVVTATATANLGTSEFSNALGITGAPSHLLNIATRLNVEGGDNVLISGFIITGPENKRLIIRGLGPSLNIPGQMNNPLLDLYDANGPVGSNDDWQTAQQDEIAATGIAPTDPREAAGIVELAPGAYSVVLRGSGGDTGIALLDAYDLDQSALAKVANVSTRGFVGTGDNVLIAGVIVGGPAGGSAKVMFRAIGPSIQGVSNPLADPILELHDSNGTTTATNDDWKSEQAATEATGIPPTDDHESALVRNLPAGSYTALVRGKNNSTGIGLVEAYNLQ